MTSAYLSEAASIERIKKWVAAYIVAHSSQSTYYVTGRDCPRVLRAAVCAGMITGIDSEACLEECREAAVKEKS